MRENLFKFRVGFSNAGKQRRKSFPCDATAEETIY